MDVMAHQDGYVSVTPLKMDVTDYSMIGAVEKWELKY